MVLVMQLNEIVSQSSVGALESSSIRRVLDSPMTTLVLGVAIAAFAVYQHLQFKAQLRRLEDVNKKQQRQIGSLKSRNNELNSGSKKDKAVIDTLTQQVRDLSGEDSLNKIAQTKAELEAQVRAIEAQVRAGEENVRTQERQIEAQCLACASKASEIDVQRARQNELRAEVANLDRTLLDTKREVSALEDRRRYLQSDMVLWAEDGYVLCHSSLFPDQSIVHCKTASSMTAVCERIQARLDGIEATESGKSGTLRSIAKHFVIENVSRVQLKRFIRFLEQGPGAFAEHLPEDQNAMKRIADYFLMPALEFETPTIKALREELTRRKEQAQDRKKKLASVEAHLEKKLASVQAHLEQKLASVEAERRASENRLGLIKRAIRQLWEAYQVHGAGSARLSELLRAVRRFG